MLIHKHYQDLCPVAASGAATKVEFDDLVDHLQGCAECRGLFRECIKVVADVLPEIAEGYLPTAQLHTENNQSPWASDNGRVSDAAQEVPSPAVRKALVQPRQSISWVRITAVAASLLVCLLIVTVYVRNRVVGPVQPSTPPQSALARPVAESQPRTEESLPQVAKMSEQLRGAQARIAELEAAVKIAQQASKAADLEKTGLQSQITDDDTRIAELRTVADNSKTRAEDREGRLIESEAALRAKSSELNTMSARLVEVSRQLNEQQELNGALGQVKDLITARTLHLVNIRETEPSAKGQRPFGHILFTQGKALMYAFDLGERGGANAKLSFQVWGEKYGTAGTIKSLGAFQADDKRDSRWRLSLDDPGLLAQIDTVFVTVEAEKKGITKPSGKKILSARMVVE